MDPDAAGGRDCGNRQCGWEGQGEGRGVRAVVFVCIGVVVEEGENAHACALRSVYGGAYWF